MKTINLPNQARDRHRKGAETSEGRFSFYAVQAFGSTSCLAARCCSCRTLRVKTGSDCASIRSRATTTMSCWTDPATLPTADLVCSRRMATRSMRRLSCGASVRTLQYPSLAVYAYETGSGSLSFRPRPPPHLLTSVFLLLCSMCLLACSLAHATGGRSG
eukprot:COSAG06_NODE_13287_length_1273_cov_1.478705_2_plen_160_part_00